MEETQKRSGQPARWNRAAIAIAAAVAVFGLLAALAFPRLQSYFLGQAAGRDAATLTLATEALAGTIDRFRPLPALVAERPMLTALLRDPENAARIDAANEALRLTAHRIGASDLYLMDISGLTLAASNYRDTSFIGRSFAYRPYFTQAIDGGIGEFFALGTTSGERGYFIAAPVEDGSRIIGVVAVKFTVDAFEDAWRGGGSEIIVTDLNNIVFMSGREDWHFRPLGPLSDAAKAEIEATRQYPLAEMAPLDAVRSPDSDGMEWLAVTEGRATTQYLIQSARLPQAGWTVSVLTPTAPAFREALRSIMGAGLVLVLLGLATAVVLQRRERIRERLAAQSAAKDLAETEVAKRTKELNAANARLVREVEERRDTEAQLRKTQAELVQAGKLAALGQMSAALSHEINQPLAALKSFADNAREFLDRGRSDDTRQNLIRISEMADRMTTISRHLRNFARRPQDRLSPTPVLAVLDDAVALMSSRLRESGARIVFDRPRAEVFITGGAVRLQQVIVNLISNALDAMADTPDPVIDVALDAHGDRVRLSISDRGHGLDPETTGEIFDPFFTTKTQGGGLGLGLSVSYNIIRDFGGTLSAAPRDGGGAVFMLDLARAEAPQHPLVAE